MASSARSTTPRCPFCGSKKTYEEGDRNYWCRSCGKVFDDEPDEGGDYSQFNPAWRMEREERRKERRAGRL